MISGSFGTIVSLCDQSERGGVQPWHCSRLPLLFMRKEVLRASRIDAATPNSAHITLEYLKRRIELLSYLLRPSEPPLKLAANACKPPQDLRIHRTPRKPPSPYDTTTYRQHGVNSSESRCRQINCHAPYSQPESRRRSFRGEDVTSSKSARRRSRME
jgi:hypothetical protein